jgi:hypothetical protein
MYKNQLQEIVVYWKNGKPYGKLEPREVIKEGAMQSWSHGELQPIMNTDGQIIGATPCSFSSERDFYNPLIICSCGVAIDFDEGICSSCKADMNMLESVFDKI